MKKTIIKNFDHHDGTKSWKTIFPKADSGNKWYYVDSQVDWIYRKVYFTANLAPVVTLCGMECEREIERKAFVAVKNLLKQWGHDENPKNILNAVEYLWEIKRVPGYIYQDFVNYFYKNMA